MQVPFVRPMSFGLDKAINYSEIPDDGRLLFVDGARNAMSKPLSLGRRTERFRIALESDVTLIGFRSYVTSDGFFFNDETILPHFDFGPTQTKFQRGLDEDTKATFLENKIVFPDAPIDFRIEEPILCLGSDEPTNYGSWIYRIIPKFISVGKEYDFPIFLPCDYSPWLRKLAALFFGDRDVYHQSPPRRYHLKNAVIPSARNGGIFFDSEVLAFYRDFAMRLGGSSPLEKIYLSRQAAERNRPGYRTIINEGELISLLEKFGVMPVEIETYSFEEQIRIVRDAKVIVAPGGSGIFNSVFAKNVEFFLDIEPNITWLHGHHTLLKSCELPHAVLLGDQLDAGNAHSAWRVNIDDVARALSQLL